MLKKQKKPTKAEQAQAQRLQEVAKTIGQELGDAYNAALDAYAEAKGKDWALQLIDDWYAGRDDRFQHNGKLYGPELRQIRNHPKHGPAFYKAFHG